MSSRGSECFYYLNARFYQLRKKRCSQNEVFEGFIRVRDDENRASWSFGVIMIQSDPKMDLPRLPIVAVTLGIPGDFGSYRSSLLFKMRFQQYTEFGFARILTLSYTLMESFHYEFKGRHVASLDDAVYSIRFPQSLQLELDFSMSLLEVSVETSSKMVESLCSLSLPPRHFSIISPEPHDAMTNISTLVLG